MPLEGTIDPVGERVIELNARYHQHSATDVLQHALEDPAFGATALVSSFGAESVVLLHMVAMIDRSVPVLFLDTQMLFAETLAYQRDVAKHLRLTNVTVRRPSRTETFLRDAEGDLHLSDPDACCRLRKVEPLEAALESFDGWISGRKRFQGADRAQIDFFENDGGRRIKVNPLVHWQPGDVQEYIENNNLPKHPLLTKGFPSIGCAPCTTRVAEGEDPRSGRWRGRQKVECGIHFVNGKVVPRPGIQATG